MQGRRITFGGLIAAMLIVMGLTALADTPQEQNQTQDVVSLWKAQYEEYLKDPEKFKSKLGEQTVPTDAVAVPNALVHGAPPSPPGENNNSGVSWSEAIPLEVYTVYNEFLGASEGSSEFTLHL